MSTTCNTRLNRTFKMKVLIQILTLWKVEKHFKAIVLANDTREFKKKNCFLYVPLKHTVLLQHLGSHKKNENASNNCVLWGVFTHGSQHSIFIIWSSTFNGCCWIWIFDMGFMGFFYFVLNTACYFRVPVMDMSLKQL